MDKQTMQKKIKKYTAFLFIFIVLSMLSNAITANIKFSHSCDNVCKEGETKEWSGTKITSKWGGKGVWLMFIVPFVSVVDEIVKCECSTTITRTIITGGEE